MTAPRRLRDPIIFCAALLLIAACGSESSNKTPRDGCQATSSCADAPDGAPSPDLDSDTTADTSEPADTTNADVSATPDLSALPTCGLDDTINTDAHPGRDSDAYRAFTDRAALEQSLAQALSGDINAATNALSGSTYDLCRGAGDDASVVVWRPQLGSGHAFIALRTAGARPLIVESPHPLNDATTLTQGLTVFKSLPARVFIAAGSHRCASDQASSCDGQTSVCVSAGAPYPISDAAHNTDSAFHAAHVALSEHFSTDLVLSLHGFSDVGASLSDGTTFATSAQAPVARLSSALRAELPDEYISACNDHPGATHDERLCGTTNAQGRHVNGSADACVTGAASSAQRFVHMEQSRAVRDSLPAVLRALDTWAP